MKRFHIHLSVADLDQATGFYSRLFGSEPSVRKDDYAKWLLDDPRLNFAISARGHAPGLNHLGFQVDEAAELAALQQRFEQADIASVAETGAACCYARSDKHWVEDPAGIAWEHFHSLGDIPVFGAPASTAQEASADGSDGTCCVPLARQAEDADDAACCVPSEQPAADRVAKDTSGPGACCAGSA